MSRAQRSPPAPATPLVRELTDVQFLRAMEAAQLPPALFGHREHLRLAFLLLRRDGPEQGCTALVQTLRRYTSAYGIAHIFDEALTLRWVARLNDAMARVPDASSVKELIAAVPDLASSRS